MKKSHFLTCSVLFLFITKSIGQEFTTVSTKDYNVLFHYYPHVFELSIPESCDSFNYEIIGAKSRPITEKKFELRTYVGTRQVKVITKTYLKDSAQFDTLNLTTSFLPRPVLFFDETELQVDSLDHYNNWDILNNSKFSVNKPRTLAINVTYTVKEWMILINGKSITGKSSSITNEVKTALRTAEVGSAICFSVKYVCDQNGRSNSIDTFNGCYHVKKY